MSSPVFTAGVVGGAEENVGVRRSKVMKISSMGETEEKHTLEQKVCIRHLYRILDPRK